LRKQSVSNNMNNMTLFSRFLAARGRRIARRGVQLDTRRGHGTQNLWEIEFVQRRVAGASVA
jgi:hypothetical protein